MLRNKITFRLIFIISMAFIVLNVIVLLFISRQMITIVDRSQREVYREKLDTITSIIDQEINLLHKTGMVQVYEDDFKERTLLSLRKTYYSEDILTIYPVILNNNGSVLLHPTYPSNFTNQMLLNFSLKAGEIRNGDFNYKDNDTGENWCIVTSVNEWNWIVYYMITLNEKYSDVRLLLSILIPVILFISICVLIFISIVLQKNLNPIIEITNSASQIAAGNLNQQITTIGKYEIATLSKSFRMMRDAVRQTISDLEKSKEDLTIILDSIGDGVIATDDRGVISRLNPIAEELTGWINSEAQGKSLNDVFILKTRSQNPINDPFQAIMNDEEIITQNDVLQLIAKKGEEYLISTKGTPIRNGSGKIVGIVLIFRNVTEKVRMEEMMIQNEKMLSVGGLAAGMAHEINNPLAGMIQSANVIANRLYYKSDIPANQKAAEEAGTTMVSIKRFMEIRGIIPMITAINESGKRVGTIINNMLNFARKSENKMCLEKISDLLDISLKFAATDYDLKKQFDFKQIDIKKEYETDIPPVFCDSSKLQQVFLNILRNGAQAMHEAKTENPQFRVKTSYSEQQERLIIEFIDNGPGIDEKTRKRIFEPFFTTKPAGIGTGLGLSVSYFIITDNHNGEMTVESSPGKGARFIIKLPLECNTK